MFNSSSNDVSRTRRIPIWDPCPFLEWNRILGFVLGVNNLKRTPPEEFFVRRGSDSLLVRNIHFFSWKFISFITLTSYEAKENCWNWKISICLEMSFIWTFFSTVGKNKLILGRSTEQRLDAIYKFRSVFLLYGI